MDRRISGRAKIMKTRFAGKIAIVTGGGGEIGRATALRLGREGATVVIVDCDRDQAEKVAAEITEGGGVQSWSIQTDVAERDQVEAMANSVSERHGRIDVLCNIAGIGPPAPLLETSDENWDKTIDVNLKGVFLCTQVVARLMVKTGGGAIVNMASTNALVGEAGLVAYNASKFGVVGLTMTAAIELAPYNIRVNAAAPGMIRTKLSQAVLDADPELARSYLRDKIPMARFGEPDEVGGAGALLASDDR